jgi:hypothetical protein
MSANLVPYKKVLGNGNFHSSVGLFCIFLILKKIFLAKDNIIDLIQTVAKFSYYKIFQYVIFKYCAFKKYLN